MPAGCVLSITERGAGRGAWRARGGARPGAWRAGAAVASR